MLAAVIAALPSACRRRLMVSCDGAGASHDLIARLDKLAARHGYQVIYSVGWELGGRERAVISAIPAHAWQIAVDERGEVRSSARHRVDRHARRHPPLKAKDGYSSTSLNHWTTGGLAVTSMAGVVSSLPAAAAACRPAATLAASLVSVSQTHR